VRGRPRWTADVGLPRGAVKKMMEVTCICCSPQKKARERAPAGTDGHSTEQRQALGVVRELLGPHLALLRGLKTRGAAGGCRRQCVVGVRERSAVEVGSLCVAPAC
jgi:hypothetical protein